MPRSSREVYVVVTDLVAGNSTSSPARALRCHGVDGIEAILSDVTLSVRLFPAFGVLPPRSDAMCITLDFVARRAKHPFG